MSIIMKYRRKNMEVKVITAGNCPLCGKPIDMVDATGKLQRIFMCSECAKKNEENRKNTEKTHNH